MNPKILALEFTKIADNLKGAEGPVFDKDGHFYMVAPEVEKDGKPAGQVLRIDLKEGKVCCCGRCHAHFSCATLL